MTPPTALFPAGASDVLFLLDLSGWIHRAWHALKRSGEHVRPAPNGEPVGVTAKVVGWLVDLLRDQQPAYLGVALDTHGPTWRHELYANFKQGRPAPEPEMLSQEQRCIDILRAHKIPCSVADGFDADDAIASATRRALACGLRVVILSSDKDLLYLTAAPGVIVWDQRSGEVIGAAEVAANQKRFGGVTAAQLPDLLALMGDDADSIPGVAGIGPKTGAELLSTFGDLEAVLTRAPTAWKPGKVRDAIVREADLARMSRRLVELRTDAPIGFDVAALRVGWEEHDAAAIRDIYMALGLGWAAGVEAMPKGRVPEVVLAASAEAERRAILGEPIAPPPTVPAPSLLPAPPPAPPPPPRLDVLTVAPALPPRDAPVVKPMQFTLPGLG